MYTFLEKKCDTWIAKWKTVNEIVDNEMTWVHISGSQFMYDDCILLNYKRIKIMILLLMMKMLIDVGNLIRIIKKFNIADDDDDEYW